MKKIFKIAFASLLAFSIAPALAVAFNQSKEVTSVQAVEPVVTADQVKYQDGDTVKTFAELPTGYTFENGVLTVTSTSTADYSIWVEDSSAGNLTIVFERDYGSNQIYFEVKTSYKFILTSSNSVNVTLAALNANGLTLSGNLNLNIVGLDYVVLTKSFDSLLSANNFYLLDNASFYCVDPIWIDADNGKYLVHIHSSLHINTTGRFVAGFIDDPISNSNPAYSFRYPASLTSFEFIRCDGIFVLYNKSHNRLYLIRDEINLSALYQFSVKTRDIDHTKFYYCATMKPYNVFYDANGGSGEMDFYGGAKDNITLLECSFTAPTGKQFKCWAENSTSGTQYAAGATYSVTKDAVMYAIWEDATAALTGTVSITGSLKYGETLTAAVTDTNNTGTLSYQWRRNGEPISSATSSTYVVTEDDIGYTLSVVVTSSVETGSIVGTASDSISKADGPAAPSGLSATACTTTDNNDGTISGVTTAMEYKLSSAADWTSGTGETLTGLDAGTYYVRVKETATHNAGENAIVVVNGYNAPIQYSVTVNNGTANPVTAEESETVTITANAPEAGKVFAGWTSSDGVVFADASASITTFVMPAKNVTVTATYADEVVPTVLQSISLSGTYKTSFEVDDTFSYEGLVVTAHYNNKADEVVTGYTVSSPDMSTTGTKTVTVTYVEEEVTKTATYQITVTAKEQPPVDPEPETPSKGGLSGGAIAGIVIGSALVVGVGGFALVWFVIKKKSWADFVALFKKK